MFTGIVQQMGKVLSLENVGSVPKLRVAQRSFANIELGESIAVNGCCLTVVCGQDILEFDLSEETLARTSLGQLEPGAPVNLERSPALSEVFRFGGHQVSGHIDTLGKVLAVKEVEGSWRFDFQAPEEFSELLIDKGSVAIDGISLTVNEPTDGHFWVAVIPHTFERTIMNTYRPERAVNLEFDLVGKYVVQTVKRFLERNP
ncbi:MAG: riboflavin synthase [Fimbriimonadaceae bacterium]